MIALAAAPGSFLRAYGGAKWAAADGILFYLVLMQMAISLGANVFPTFMALGRPEVTWQWNLFITVVQSASILVTAHWGILAVIKGLAVSAWVMALAVYWLSKAAQFRFIDYWRSMAPLIGYLPPSIALGEGIQHLIGKNHAIESFVVSSFAAVLLYVSLMLTTDRQAKQLLQEGTRVLRSRLLSDGARA